MLALGVAAVLGGVGTILIAVAEPVRAWRPEEERHGSILGALASRGVLTLIGLSACLGLGFGGTEVGFPAFAEGHGGAELGSIPLSLFAGGSLVGGLVAGARVTLPPLPMLRISAVVLAFGLALPLLGWSLPSMSVLAFVAGLAIAPVVMSAYGLVDAVAARGTAAEAFSWITTAVFAGFSVGIDHAQRQCVRGFLRPGHGGCRAGRRGRRGRAGPRGGGGSGKTGRGAAPLGVFARAPALPVSFRG